MEFTERERTTLTNGLRVAAERFDGHVKTMREGGQERLAEQFERQARESRELADKIEEAE